MSRATTRRHAPLHHHHTLPPPPHRRHLHHPLATTAATSNSSPLHHEPPSPTPSTTTLHSLITIYTMAAAYIITPSSPPHPHHNHHIIIDTTKGALVLLSRHRKGACGIYKHDKGVFGFAQPRKGSANRSTTSIYAMKFALRNKSKLGFIDGTCKRKSDDPVLANQWDLCNFVVVTWILNSFLMGLDDVYQPIRSNILTREPLPLVKTAFAIISREEFHRNVTSMGSASKSPSVSAFAAKAFNNKNSVKRGNENNKNNVKREPNLNLKCTNCNKDSHTIERTKAKIVNIKDLKLNESVTLFNVLVVPEYNDLKRNMIVGTGDMHGGLYLFDTTSKQFVSNLSTNCYVSKTLWHNILGHPANQVLQGPYKVTRKKATNPFSPLLMIIPGLYGFICLKVKMKGVFVKSSSSC
ncbi:hypothetical protein Tco_0866348 [Tanacetum coccineum]